MAFNVTLYSHSKRDNSTKRPADSGTTHSCVMKHGCGILNPSISLDLGLSTDPSNFNYAYIPAFGRYYYIEEWYFEERLWTAQLKVDVLATYKSQIGDANLYVLRASAENNGDVTDLLYPAMTGCVFNRVSHQNPWSGATYVVGVVNDVATFGSNSYYALDTSNTAVMCRNLTDVERIISEDYSFNLDDASAGLQLSLVDPLQYIKSCVMLPVAVGDISNTVASSDIPVFNWNSGASGQKVFQNSRIVKSYSFTIPKHPDTSSRGNYVNAAPFTSMTLTIPPWGCIDIDTSVTCNANIVSDGKLHIEVEIDPISGKGILIVKCNNIILNRLEAQIGVPISLSSVTRDYIGAVTSTVGAIGGMSLGAIAGGLAGAGSIFSGLASLGNAAESLMPRAQTVGSTGSFVANRGEFRLDAQFFIPIADDNAHNGRPLCAMRTVKNLGGYMLIQDGDIETTGTRTEDEQIKNYLETGFYYE